MEIKVGEYVRTKNGEISIFRGWNNNPKSQWSCKLEFQKVKTWKYCCEEYIKSHSPSILDLIEEGDYVNGKCVYSIGTVIGNLPIINNTDGTFTPSNDIKTIVTHEQMREMEYKL